MTSFPISPTTMPTPIDAIYPGAVIGEAPIFDVTVVGVVDFALASQDMWMSYLG